LGKETTASRGGKVTRPKKGKIQLRPGPDSCRGDWKTVKEGLGEQGRRKEEGVMQPGLRKKLHNGRGELSRIMFKKKTFGKRKGGSG